MRFSVLADCWGPEGYFICLFIKRLVQLFMRIKDWRMAVLIKGMKGCSPKKFVHLLVWCRTSNFSRGALYQGRASHCSYESLYKFGPSDELWKSQFKNVLWKLMGACEFKSMNVLLLSVPMSQRLFTFTARISMLHPHAQKSIKCLISSFSVLALSSLLLT